MSVKAQLTKETFELSIFFILYSNHAYKNKTSNKPYYHSSNPTKGRFRTQLREACKLTPPHYLLTNSVMTSTKQDLIIKAWNNNIILI